MVDIETINRIKDRLTVGHKYPQWQGVNLTPQERAELRQYLLQLEEENGSLRDHLRRVDMDIQELRDKIQQLEIKRDQK